MIDEMIDHFEEKRENKYVILDDVDQNKEFSNKYEEVWTESKKKIETINSDEKIEYGIDF